MYVSCRLVVHTPSVIAHDTPRQFPHPPSDSRLTRSILLSSRLRQSAFKESWRALGRAARRPHLWGFIPNCTFNVLCCLCCRSLTRCSPQDALRSSSQPTKDPRLEFYMMYGRETAKYDADYAKKYDDDLNTTLIFVRPSLFSLVKYLTCSHRPVCSLPSAQPSSSMSTRASDPIPTSNLRPSSVPFSSPSTSPPSPVRPPPSHLSRKAHRARSSLSPV